MAFVRLRKGEVKVGEPLPWSVFRESGALLLHKGEEVESRHQQEMLEAQGYRHDEATDRINILLQKRIDDPFAFIDEMHTHLKHLLRNLTLPTPDAPARINYMSQLLIRLCNEFPDAMLGVVHRFRERPYSITHSIHTAILSALLARGMELDEAQQLRIVCAGFTANLGMLDLQDSLENQTTPMTDEQRQRLHNHPLESEALLRLNVTTDELWLKIVRQHHESLDGSGYPDGLAGDAVVLGARIVAIADRYSAMVTPHAYRDASLAGQVLKKLYEEKGVKMDERLIQLLIHILGIYPPGCFVRLKNGETALVTHHHHTPGDRWPRVSSFKGKDGHFYIKPLIHDTNLPEYAIHCMVAEEKVPFTNPVMWGYSQPSIT